MPSSARSHQNPSGESAARIFVIASVLVFLGVSVWFWAQAPDTVASHFDSGGQPDDWMSKTGFLWIFVPIGVGLPVLMSTRPLVDKLPLSLINAPFKDYWMERGEKAYLFDCLMEFMRLVAGLLALLCASVLVIIMEEARSATMPDWMTFIPTAVFLVATGLGVWRLYRRLTPPR